ncbi:hypothetical protein MAPG_04481 [Magnaporthiopsis poae ATCC 64411]|uniref:Dihydrodipicolinate synthase n=1 Tax=Magnaporthiopsis poae (strain ATCC 64411 / 73-15) TaxID=644358 RepID=A0A0C4DWU8_MAGP6|nr:hypothetical protein MAPG_04481 [Magnaporthiopsis poae ATCC 64411]
MSPSAINGNSSNGAHQNGTDGANDGSTRRLTRGIYVPTVAFFNEDETLNLDTTRAHATRLAKTGVAGIVVQGSNGEAVHLDRDERKLITRTTRDSEVALQKYNGYGGPPRRPCALPEGDALAKMTDGFAELARCERELEAQQTLKA